MKSIFTLWATLEERLAFEKRRWEAWQAEIELVKILTDLGCSFEFTGQEKTLDMNMWLMIFDIRGDPTVRSIRFQPDLYGVNKLYLGTPAGIAWWEAKMNQTEGTEYFAIEVDCWEELRARQQFMGVRINVGIKDTDGRWYAARIQDLKYFDTVIPERPNRGSSQPFVRIWKTSMRPLMEAWQLWTSPMWRISEAAEPKTWFESMIPKQPDYQPQPPESIPPVSSVESGPTPTEQRVMKKLPISKVDDPL